MVKMLYDFDVSAIYNSSFYSAYYKNKIPIDKDFLINNIKHSNMLIDLHFLGGGYDSVAIIDSETLKSYIIEPANGLIIAHDLIKQFCGYEEKRRADFSNFRFEIYSLLDETIFRHHRNGDEYLLIANLINHFEDEKVEVFFSYPNSDYCFKCSYLDLIPELIIFGEKMLQLYSIIISDFKEFAIFKELESMLFNKNVLREKYEHLIIKNNTSKSFMDKIPKSIK